MMLNLKPCQRCGLRLPQAFLSGDSVCRCCEESCASCGDAEADYDAVEHAWVCPSCRRAQGQRGEIAASCASCGVSRHLVMAAGRTACLRCTFSPGWNRGSESAG